MNFRNPILAATVLALASLAACQTPSPSPSSSPLPNFVELFPDGSLFASPEALRIAAGLRQRVVNMGGCNVNICFALDGSGSITEEEWEMQKDFVSFIASIVAGGGDAGLAATQYGLRNVDITRLTSDANDFLLRVEAATLENARRTFIAAGLGFCIREFRPRLEDANKIVLIGDGRSNFGGDPVRLARRFRNRYDGDICAVGIGFRDNRILRRVAGSPTRVLNIDSYFELLDIVDQIVEEVCGI